MDQLPAIKARTEAMQLKGRESLATARKEINSIKCQAKGIELLMRAATLFAVVAPFFDLMPAWGTWVMGGGVMLLPMPFYFSLQQKVHQNERILSSLTQAWAFLLAEIAKAKGTFLTLPSYVEEDRVAVVDGRLKCDHAKSDELEARAKKYRASDLIDLHNKYDLIVTPPALVHFSLQRAQVDHSLIQWKVWSNEIAKAKEQLVHGGAPLPSTLLRYDMVFHEIHAHLVAFSSAFYDSKVKAEKVTKEHLASFNRLLKEHGKPPLNERPIHAQMFYVETMLTAKKRKEHASADLRVKNVISKSSFWEALTRAPQFDSFQWKSKHEVGLLEIDRKLVSNYRKYEITKFLISGLFIALSTYFYSYSDIEEQWINLGFVVTGLTLYHLHGKLHSHLFDQLEAKKEALKLDEQRDIVSHYADTKKLYRKERASR